eukprot:gnl/TRDRNA2_/TRDRNA2_167128_c0_seq1.p1 gnl/TRDRNA2_/TRDRNA2_167128_c0~~gnl/TRDRNA2_/TRDRNA2_167128_c0_seq1.p1  ORF type:complete len:733 (+),score=168.33 gnl/TRDRNA2_/TRDRNA2_167128_c0_seq1:302-2200(+)
MYVTHDWNSEYPEQDNRVAGSHQLKVNFDAPDGEAELCLTGPISLPTVQNPTTLTWGHEAPVTFAECNASNWLQFWVQDIYRNSTLLAPKLADSWTTWRMQSNNSFDGAGDQSLFESDMSFNNCLRWSGKELSVESPCQENSDNMFRLAPTTSVLTRDALKDREVQAGFARVKEIKEAARKKAKADATAKAKAAENATANPKAERKAAAEQKKEEDAAAKKKPEEHAAAKPKAEDDAVAKKKSEEDRDARKGTVFSIKKAIEDTADRRREEEEEDAAAPTVLAAAVRKKPEEHAAANAEAVDDAAAYPFLVAAKCNEERRAAAEKKKEEEAAAAYAEREAAAKKQAEEDAAAKEKAGGPVNAAIAAAKDKFYTATKDNEEDEAMHIKDERFNVMGKGTSTLLHVPRGARLSQAALVVVADIQELDESARHHNRTEYLNKSKCPPTFIRNLFIKGNLLGSLAAVSFHARTDSRPFWMHLGKGDLWLSDDSITSTAISAHVSKLGNLKNISFAVTPGNSVTRSPERIQLKLGEINITVFRPHARNGEQWQFLNVHVSGLESLKHGTNKIGGLLGSRMLRPGSSDLAEQGKDKCLIMRTQKKVVVNHDADPTLLTEHKIKEIALYKAESEDLVAA